MMNTLRISSLNSGSKTCLAPQRYTASIKKTNTYYHPKNKKEFRCELCRKTSTRKFNLQEHERTQ